MCHLWTKCYVNPLITQRSQVQILPPLLCVTHGSRFPKGTATCAFALRSVEGNFDQTKPILGCLVRLPALSADQLRRLEAAASNNPHVARAFHGRTSTLVVVNGIVAERSAPGMSPPGSDALPDILRIARRGGHR